MKLTAKNFTECTEAELRIILDWRNCYAVAQNSIDSAEITWERHVAFVKSLEGTPDRGYFLVSEGAEQLGVISFKDINAISAEVGYYKNPSVIKKGIGVLLLDFAVETAKNRYGLREIITRVLTGNTASEKSIERAGFVILESNEPYADSDGRQLLLNVYKRVL